MKKILVLLSMFFAVPALADTVKSLNYSTQTGKIQAITGQNGTKVLSPTSTPLVYNIGNFNPSATTLVNTTSTCANNSVATGSEVIAVSCSSGVFTFTFSRIGFYMMQANFRHQHANVYTQWNINTQSLGTATILGQLTAVDFTEKIESATASADGMGSMKGQLIQVTASGQTFTYRFSISTVVSGTTVQHAQTGTVFITPL